jgi:hypothetical protein
MLWFESKLASLMGCVLPSTSNTSWFVGVNDFSGNTHGCGMKFRVAPLNERFAALWLSPLDK